MKTSVSSEHKTIELRNRSEGGAAPRVGHPADDALNAAHHVTEAQGAVNPTQSGAEKPASRTRK